ncbi:TPA: GHKL domain-containing protein [Streptococcus suis]|uniref:sensor histidine kinase n=1 Tax=Streptococcus suis TaxID=1307 RepID=UPI0005CE869C|nr:GHKL domain-containing protein [Streptococcus suis]NQG58591.1 GHKL domain-containing protein [Streptococcus suis]NQJ48461.1 GHKL domain-containing protein [Streptococcus suis]NQJ54872.1 GHKL domain-containing protein [Streptococcus suis]CYV61266.1 putative sensor histidine kinase BlpH [Streptococcus suis]HEM4388057.1 GHKL domain-containing protein [Streptococcus suis]
MTISPGYDALFFIDILIRLYIFQQISGFGMTTKKKIAIAVIITLASILLSGTFQLWEPFSLLLIVSFFKTDWNKTQKIFYCLLPFVIGDMFQRIIGLYLRFIFDIDIISFNSSPFFNIILTLLLVPFYTILFKGLGIESKNLQVDTLDQTFKKIFISLNVFFITYFLIIRGMIQLEIAIENGLILNIDTYFIRTNVLLIYFTIFIISMLYLNYQKKEKQDKEIQELKDKQLADLGRYSRHVESLYKEIRSFRHDYTNILISLNEAIKEEDIVAIRTIYSEVIADSDRKFYDGKYDIARLSNIQNPAVKSLLSSKMLEAQKKGIAISVEVDAEIEPPALELIEFITILSILLDNAIDAAEQCVNGNIVFAYFQEDDRKIIVVENTTVEDKVSTSHIFEYGHSTKGDNRGIGLANVKTILDNYPKFSISTNSSNHRFVQELVFLE